MRRIAARRTAAEARRFPLTRRLWAVLPAKQVWLLLFLLPFVVAGGASGGYYLRLHHVTREMSLAGLPLAAAPAAARRILVLAPHCDDETLGVGGMIADARRAGATVTVAFLTNGDGFPVAAGRALRDVHLSPADYVRFAERRQAESLGALAELGVSAENVVFFGYPDRGLEPLWEAFWDPSRPFRSPYTGHVRSPYRRTYTPGAPHCGAALLADLERLLKTARPTDIYVTHPSDDHPDHAIAAAFAQAALQAARDRGDVWAGAARLRYYLVHRGDWPLPQGLHPDEPLTPPAGLRNLDTRWEVYGLSVAAREAKARALGKYRSQMAVTRRFLTSFVRANELYGTLPEPPARAGNGAIWESAPDAIRDDVVRYAGPSADLRGIAVRGDAGGLRVRVLTRGPISPRVRYSLLLRVTGGGKTRFLALNLPANRGVARGKGAKPGWHVPAAVIVRAGSIEAVVPWETLDLKAGTAWRLWVASETHWVRVPVDRTGYRAFDLQGHPLAGANIGPPRQRPSPLTEATARFRRSAG